jgi:predicted esterase
MKRLEFVFDSLNSENYAKPITAFVVEPEKISSGTGMALFTHGWGGNRFQHRDKMEYAAENLDVVAVSVEYRMSGFDFNPVTGAGAYVPYDGSFLQLFDVLNGLRRALDIYSGINRKRLYHYGGSQGGHIALLSALMAPETFAFVYASSPITEFDECRQRWSGREFAEHEIIVRSPLRHAPLFNTRIFLEHGDADETVPVDHSVKFERALLDAGLKPVVRYYPGGSHSLEPAISKIDAFKNMGAEPMREMTNPAEADDFARCSVVELKCGPKTLRVDWGQPTGSLELVAWID